MVSNEVALWILEEIKNQLKGRNEHKKQSTTASVDQNPSILKELKIIMFGQSKMMDNFNQLTQKGNKMEKNNEHHDSKNEPHGRNNEQHGKNNEHHVKNNPGIEKN